MALLSVVALLCLTALMFLTKIMKNTCYTKYTEMQIWRSERLSTNERENETDCSRSTKLRNPGYLLHNTKYKWESQAKEGSKMVKE
jgi:hypothetical protein